jgi:hypothetical protein
MVSASRKEIIKGFMEKAKEEVTGLNKGLNQGFQSAIGLAWCWISFEAFTCARYGKDGVWERIDNFCDEYSKEYFQDYPSMPDEFKKYMVGLMRYSVLDMRPLHLDDPPTKIYDGKDLKQVLRIIYKVRNNLFHGGKDMNDEKDMNLVLYSSKVLYHILEKFLSKADLI